MIVNRKTGVLGNLVVKAERRDHLNYVVVDNEGKFLAGYNYIGELIKDWKDINVVLSDEQKKIIKAWADLCRTKDLWCVGKNGHMYRGVWKEPSWRLIAGRNPKDSDDKPWGETVMLEFYGECPFKFGWVNVDEICKDGDDKETDGKAS